MTWLLEDPTPTLVGGAVLITMAAIVYSSLRTKASLAALAALVLLNAVAVAVEWIVQTPREQVAAAMDGLLDAVEMNDLAGVLDRIDPAATTILADAERLMPEVAVDKANRIGELVISLEGGAEPTGATVECRVFVQGRHRRTGARGGGPADVRLHFSRRGGAWLLDDYAADKALRQGVSKLRSKP